MTLTICVLVSSVYLRGVMQQTSGQWVASSCYPTKFSIRAPPIPLHNWSYLICPMNYLCKEASLLLLIHYNLPSTCRGAKVTWYSATRLRFTVTPFGMSKGATIAWGCFHFLSVVWSLLRNSTYMMHAAARRLFTKQLLWLQNDLYSIYRFWMVWTDLQVGCLQNYQIFTSEIGCRGDHYCGISATGSHKTDTDLNKKVNYSIWNQPLE